MSKRNGGIGIVVYQRFLSKHNLHIVGTDIDGDPFVDFRDASASVRLERWTQLLRVLQDLPEHERVKHFDMSEWAQQTDCGTIACAAGHAGMDRWFQGQGFILDFELNMMSSVEGFFGREGADRIFYDETRRPIEQVEQEIRDYIDILKRDL